MYIYVIMYYRFGFWLFLSIAVIQKEIGLRNNCSNNTPTHTTDTSRLSSSPVRGFVHDVWLSIYFFRERESSIINVFLYLILIGESVTTNFYFIQIMMQKICLVNEFLGESWARVLRVDGRAVRFEVKPAAIEHNIFLDFLRGFSVLYS
jgi:hypothetical protein